MKRNFFDGIKFIFWDFDGVIKDSVAVKGEAYMTVFEEFFNQEIALQVRDFHLKNGGMSRYEKIPTCLRSICNVENEVLSIELQERFAEIVVDKVCSADWVPGVLEFLERSFTQNLNFILSATPHDELGTILARLELLRFDGWGGSPTKKAELGAKFLFDFGLTPNEGCFIGDSLVDYETAEQLGLPFVHRRGVGMPIEGSLMSLKDFCELGVLDDE